MARPRSPAHVAWKAAAAQEVMEGSELLRIMARVKARVIESVRVRRARRDGAK